MRSALMVLAGLLLVGIGATELHGELQVLRDGKLREATIVSTAPDHSFRGPSCWYPMVIIGSASSKTSTIEFPCRSEASARAAVGSAMDVRVHAAGRDRVRDPRGWPRDLAMPLAALLAGIGLVLEPWLSRRVLDADERRDIGNVFAVTIGPGLVLVGWAMAWDLWVAGRHAWSVGMAAAITLIFAGVVVMLRRGFRRGTAGGS